MTSRFKVPPMVNSPDLIIHHLEYGKVFKITGDPDHPYGVETLAFGRGARRTFRWGCRRFFNLFDSPHSLGFSNVRLCRGCGATLKKKALKKRVQRQCHEQARVFHDDRMIGGRWRQPKLTVLPLN